MTIDVTMPRAGSPPARKRFSTGLRTPLGHAVMIVLSLVCLFPVYWMIISSLRPANALLDDTFWPSAITLENYTYALKAIPIGSMLVNTVIVSTVVTAFQLLTGLLAAYAFVRYRFPFDKFVYALMAMTWLIPLQVVMIPNYLLVVRLGLLDSLTALILPHFASALAILLFTQSMRAFPKEVLEAARMDGAGGWRVLWEIIVPNLQGMIASLTILVFISTWNEYFWPLLLSRTPDNSVVQIGIQMFMTAEGTQWGPLMAASTMASLPILILYVLLQRQVVQSFMKSGIR